MQGPLHRGALVDGVLMRRAFLVLGPAEALVEMVVFLAVLVGGGWAYGDSPRRPSCWPSPPGARSRRSCSASWPMPSPAGAPAAPVGRWSLRGNRLLLWAVGAELVFLRRHPRLARRSPRLLGGSMPDPAGWALALLVVPAVIAADALHKAARRWGRGASSR